MDTQAILDELLEVLAGTGVTIRTEPMGGGADGLCLLKDEQVFFVDTQSSLLETASAAARAAAQACDLDAIYLRPRVRQFVAEHAEA